MATLIKHQGIPFEDLFDPDIIGDGPIAHGCAHNGQPLRFAHIQYGAKRPDVNFRVNNLDVSNLWAAKGTASYVSSGGVPGKVMGSDVGYPSAKASVSVTYHSNGTASWEGTAHGGGSGTWARSNPADYDILFTEQPGGTTSGFLAGTLNQWLALSSSWTISTSASASNGRQQTVSKYVRVQIRRRADGRVWVDYVLQLWCTAAADG